MSGFNVVDTVQNLIDRDLFESGDVAGNDMLEILDFYRNNGVPLTTEQVEALFLLREMGLNDIAVFASAIRPMLTPVKMYHEAINKITMADRIKGTAKLDKILKAQVASPSVPNASDYTPKAMKEKDLK